MPFGILQYVQCILHGLTSVLLCVPFIFADNESVDLVVICDDFPWVMESSIVYILDRGYFDNRGAFFQFMQRLNLAGDEA